MVDNREKDIPPLSESATGTSFQNMRCFERLVALSCPPWLMNAEVVVAPNHRAVVTTGQGRQLRPGSGVRFAILIKSAARPTSEIANRTPDPTRSQIGDRGLIGVFVRFDEKVTTLGMLRDARRLRGGSGVRFAIPCLSH